MWSSVVVFVDELIDVCLEFGDGSGWRPGGHPLFEGLLESFNFACRGGVVGACVFLGDAEFG